MNNIRYNNISTVLQTSKANAHVFVYPHVTRRLSVETDISVEYIKCITLLPFEPLY